MSTMLNSKVLCVDSSDSKQTTCFSTSLLHRSMEALSDALMLSAVMCEIGCFSFPSFVGCTRLWINNRLAANLVMSLHLAIGH